MPRAFNAETIRRNLYRFLGEDARDYLPYAVTENDFLKRLEPEELENIQQNIVYSMIRRKTFGGAKVKKMADYCGSIRTG